MRRKKVNKGGIVYSTDENFKYDSGEQQSVDRVPEHEQPVKIQLDRKQRAGKSVTLVYGFDKTDEEIEQLCKLLKRHCGTGGSSKQGEIIIQGDFREKILQWLRKNDYTKAKII